ncbi:MAG: PLP-dependent aminotransferase family protein, partial [Microvirga sp.]
MSDTAFRFASLFSTDLPPPALRFSGLPRYNFGTGHNDPEMVPTEELASAVAEMLRDHGPTLALYNLGQNPLGFETLRKVVQAKVARTRGIATSLDDILITSGSLQGMDLVNQVLLQRGDTVILEEFTYSAALSKLRKLGVHYHGATLDEGGICIESLARLLADLRDKGTVPKYIYTIPTVQNPTGSILSLERRRKLLALSAEYGVPIYEDECYADVLFSRDAPPALYALDPTRVIHIGSFSKTLAPALRVGYVLADWAVLSRMLACKTDGGTAALDQMVTAEYFRLHFDAHVGRLSEVLKEKLDVLTEAVHEEFGTDAEFRRPEGGLFLWLKLPEGVDVRSFAAAAAAQGVVYNAGPEVACDPDGGRDCLRLCYGSLTKADIREGVARLAQACFEATGTPTRGRNHV